MERRVYDLDIIGYCRDHLGMDDLLFKLCHILIIYLFAYHLIKALIHSLCLIHGLHGTEIGDGVNLGDYAGIVGRGNLCTVFPIYLIAVILGRVMACGHHYTCGAA